MEIRKLLLVGALLPLTGLAQEMDYTFVEAAYVDTESDVGPFDVDGDGLALKGSLSITDSAFIFADYYSRDLDFGLDASGYDLGAGMRWPLREQLDLVGDVAWVHVEVDTPGPGEVDDDGLGLGVGLRGRVREDIEVQGGIRYVDLDRSNTFLSFGGRYYLTETVAVGLGLDLDDDDTGWSVSVRAEFGN